MEIGRLKELLGLSGEDTSRDTSLQFILDDVQETILNYCNLEEIPSGLINTAYRMAIDLYRYDAPGEAAAPMRVSSISEGDTSTSFGRVSDELEGGILRDYKSQLNRYRKLRW